MANLSDVLTPAPTDDPGRFTLEVPTGWQQGRGAFGGLVLGAMVRAMEASEPERDRVLRSITGEIAGPVPLGASDIHVRVVRRGNGVSVLRAELTNANDTLAVATAVLGKARDIAHAWAPPPPPIPPWEDTPVSPVGPPFAPDFTQFFELRVTGPIPMSGGTDPRAEGFVRPREPIAQIGAAEIIAYADAYWPAGLAIEPAPRPIGTVAFTLQHFPPKKPLDPSIPLFHRAHATVAHEGFLVETRELWTPDGQLVALNPQTFVWIR